LIFGHFQLSESESGGKRVEISAGKYSSQLNRDPIGL
jgi:hypothetical protein